MVLNTASGSRKKKIFKANKKEGWKQFLFFIRVKNTPYNEVKLNNINIERGKEK